MNEKWTKGEWKVLKHSWSDSSIYRGGTKIASLELDEEEVTEENQDDHEAEQAANARLIASAPELYEALKMVSEAEWNNLSTDHQRVVYFALAKARGEPKK